MMHPIGMRLAMIEDMKLTSLISLVLAALSLSAVACTVTNNGPAGAVSGPKCNQLASKCSSCTTPGLKQTCNDAVATKDESSCQDGLDDKDIQANCTGSSSSSGSDAGGGGGGGTDAGVSVDPGNCPKGGCAETCNANATCGYDCAGGGCEQSCGASGHCTFECAGGGCTQVCAANATCDFTCAGGNCHQDCSAVGAACTKTCAGNNCT